MRINIVDIKPLKGGKKKITSNEGYVYYAESGLEIPTTKNVDITVEPVEKDGKMFEVVKVIKAVEPVAVVPKSANIDVAKLVDTPGTVEVVPSLPVTSLPETKAPGGEAPVKKAGSVKVEVREEAPVEWVEPKPKYLGDFMKPWLPSESIKTQRTSVILNTIASPAYAELIIGKNVEESLKTFDALVDHYLAKLDEVKGR